MDSLLVIIIWMKPLGSKIFLMCYLDKTTKWHCLHQNVPAHVSSFQTDIPSEHLSPEFKHEYLLQNMLALTWFHLSKFTRHWKNNNFYNCLNVSILQLNEEYMLCIAISTHIIVNMNNHSNCNYNLYSA